MSLEEHRQARITAWILAGGLLLHLAQLRNSSAILSAAILLLLAGTMLRGWQIFVSRWLGNGLLVIGVVLLFFTQTRFNPTQLIGEMAAIIGSTLLLRPLNPSRGLWILLSLVMLLLALILQGAAAIGLVWILLFAGAMMILAEQIHRPPEAQTSLWTSLLRSLRIVIPVGTVVTLIFWLFPNFAPQRPTPSVGFSGSEIMNPGDITELNASGRIALVATFAKDQALPPANSLYWRGQVLEKNEGLRWLRANDRGRKPRSMDDVKPDESRPHWRYSQTLVPNSGGVLPVLDHAIALDATRFDQKIVVLDTGGMVLRAVGAGRLKLEVMASPERVADLPDPTGDLDVPPETSADPTVQATVQQLISPERSLPENFDNLANYLQNSGFEYTLQPGRIPAAEVAGFLNKRRRGFCEHYAAAVANLLRLGGVPARIVTGYRGGDWNPWIRSITVRDSDAHAWIEAWDAATQRWLRFDPTVYVAPELSAQLERNLDSDHWPWPRLALSYAGTAITLGVTAVSQFFEALGASMEWDYLLPTLLGIFALLTAWQLIQQFRRRSRAQTDRITALIMDLEIQAARSHRSRRNGETPLAWLKRLSEESRSDAEKESITQFAAEFETVVYQKNPGPFSALAAAGRRLKISWKKLPKIER